MSDAALNSGGSSDSPFLYPEEEWPAAEARFWARVDKSKECWDWKPAKNVSDYCYFAIGNKRNMSVHRLSYRLAYGRVPDGREVDHSCRRRICVNPEHLRAATHKQNAENKGAQINSSTGVRGVSKSGNGRKFIGSIGHMGKSCYLGTYSTIAEAEAVVVAKRNELFTHNDADRVEA